MSTSSIPLSGEDAHSILATIEAASLANWGFTLYRTDYAPSRSAKFTQLVESISRQTFESIFAKPFGMPLPKKPSQATQLRQELWEAFELDVRDDEAVHGGLGMEELRALHLAERNGREVRMIVGDEPVGEEEDEEREEIFVIRQELVFFVADDEVLTKGVDEGWVKVADAKYTKKEFEVTEGNKREVWQDYWGWWKMKVDGSPALWSTLDIDRELSLLVPGRRVEEDAEVWDGEL
ncbi:hypothetical protein OQA88_7678 [Cercophora sp. LCS_1]